MHSHTLFFLFGPDAQGLLLFLDFLHQLALHMMFVVVFLFTLRPYHSCKILEQTESTLNGHGFRLLLYILEQRSCVRISVVSRGLQP